MEKQKLLDVGYCETDNKQQNGENMLDTLFKKFNDDTIFIAQTTKKDDLAGMILLTKNQVEELYNKICV